MRSYLEENGIVSQMRNEFSSSVMGEVAFFDVWPELWVDEKSASEANVLLADMQTEPTDGPKWQCLQCSESNPGTFASCWQCGQSASNP